MLAIMARESGGGDVCSKGAHGEIGIFQYLPSTWDGYGEGWVDSGSVDKCWKTAGKDTQAYEDYFRNHVMAEARVPHVDANAWDPYNQIPATGAWLESNTTRAVCTRWTTYPGAIWEVSVRLGRAPLNSCY